MAVALTEESKKTYSDGNQKKIVYKAAFTVTYPSGGYTVNNSVLPDAEQDFKRIDRVLALPQISRAGYMYVVDYEEIDNTDTDNPFFKIRVFHEDTGAGGYTELVAGVTFIEDHYFEVEGIKKRGVLD